MCNLKKIIHNIIIYIYISYLITLTYQKIFFNCVKYKKYTYYIYIIAKDIFIM